ncbi:MAG: exonuclease domain-containing protein, partial [Alphaproteobacteria bacterium]|nr:exonuclease domain-containing protein [Alphaproteobacteria bacterium]
MNEIRSLLVVDLEATCSDDDSVPKHEMEIIEIGAVLVEPAGLQPVGEFQSFVRPGLHPRLTGFCTGLTTIRQSDVDAAPRFPEVLKRFA